MLYFAGQLYYDKQIVVWTNHSGHFQPPENVKHKVGLPLEKFAPMSSPRIKKLIEQRYWGYFFFQQSLISPISFNIINIMF